jgi:uncharacterized protein YbcI
VPWRHRRPEVSSSSPSPCHLAPGGRSKEYYGRGLEKTKTYVHDDLVVCLLRGGFARAEQTLLEGGHGDDVIRQRMVFQAVMRERFEHIVEKATGRRVIGFMSGNQQNPDMICEIFVLAPNDIAH